jgi:UDP-N-acetylglucosamine 2-epimerase (non-hydrolysing)
MAPTPTKVLFIFGTRPEAIKLCPVVLHLKSRSTEFTTRVCVTGQHRDMLDQVLRVFQVSPDHDLDIMRPGQSLYQSTARIIAALEPIIREEAPDVVLVQGDTTTTFCGALSAFLSKVAVGHVEAGLRTHDVYSPFPEEMNRVLTGRIASLHFAATRDAACNLHKEGVSEEFVTITGNTGIDAVLYIKKALETGKLAGIDHMPSNASRKLILVTAHRRESFGDGLKHICEAVLRLANRGDVEIVYPVHPNPNVRSTVNRFLANHRSIKLIEPLDYVPFVDMMRRAHFILTDSGGIQEEAPSLGKPVLVLRENTERPEGVTAGTARLVGTSADRILLEAGRLLDDPVAYSSMARRHNPYGDGHASERIADAIKSWHLRAHDYAEVTCGKC